MSIEAQDATNYRPSRSAMRHSGGRQRVKGWWRCEWQQCRTGEHTGSGLIMQQHKETHKSIKLSAPASFVFCFLVSDADTSLPRKLKCLPCNTSVPTLIPWKLAVSQFRGTHPSSASFGDTDLVQCITVSRQRLSHFDDPPQMWPAFSRPHIWTGHEGSALQTLYVFFRVVGPKTLRGNETGEMFQQAFWTLAVFEENKVVDESKVQAGGLGWERREELPAFPQRNWNLNGLTNAEWTLKCAWGTAGRRDDGDRGRGGGRSQSEDGAVSHALETSKQTHPQTERRTATMERGKTN